MKFGLSLFGLSPRYYPEIAAAAEAAGFESVWVPEHLVMPAAIPATYPYSESGYPPIDPGTPLFDPWIVLASIAQATTTIRLATNVYVLPLRHPLVTARSVVTLDRVSGGRVTLGAGAGWLEEEYDLVGQDFHTRGRRMDEIIAILRRVWDRSEEVIDHHGDFYDLGPFRFSPKPVQKPTIPIEVGGASKAALRRAGRLGDGWVAIGADERTTLGRMIAELQSYRSAAGRENLPFEVTAGGGTTASDATALSELGVTRAVVGPRPGGAASGRLDVKHFVDFTARYADEVISKV